MFHDLDSPVVAVPIGINAPFALSFTRHDPYVGCNFVVEVNGLVVGGFRDVQGLDAEIRMTEVVEGGENSFVHHLPGETRHSNIVLSHGLTDVDTLWVWFDEVSRGIITRRNISILLLDLERAPAMWWQVRDALPVKWKGPHLSAVNEAEVATESLELVHRGITKPRESRLLSARRAAAAHQSPLPSSPFSFPR